MLLPPSGSPSSSPPDTDAEVLAPTGCVVCGEDAVDGTVCSRDCAVEAERQVAGNISELRQLGSDRNGRARRRVLTSRNGRLTDAMLSWRPEDLGA
jgi:hypothetical protein